MTKHIIYIYFHYILKSIPPFITYRNPQQGTKPLKEPRSQSFNHPTNTSTKSLNCVQRLQKEDRQKGTEPAIAVRQDEVRFEQLIVAAGRPMIVRFLARSTHLQKFGA